MSDGADGLSVIPPRVSTVNSWSRPLLEHVLRGIGLQSGVAYWPEFRAPWGCRHDSESGRTEPEQLNLDSNVV
jgi:hypothetical protein